MSKTIADVYSPSGHFGASLNCGVVTARVRTATGEHAEVQMSLHSWCGMIEHSRETVQMAGTPKETV